MAKYRLLAAHFSEDDKLLPADTIVGDGCAHAWTRPPTHLMIGLDAESRKLVAAATERAGDQRELDHQLRLVGKLPK